MEAIILAGGLGKRLRTKVKNVPKSMALINSRPFLEYQLDNLISQGIKKFIFSVGYKSEHIYNHFSNSYKNYSIIYATEKELLGTGGAIKNAMKYIKGDNVLVVNGDSILFSDISAQYKLHKKTNADVTLALKPMKKIKRYGTVELDDKGKVIQFLEKKTLEKGIINTGVYIFSTQGFKKINLPKKFSIEKDFFESQINQLNFFGFISKNYFLDIGIPEDFKKAQYEIGVFPKINKHWTLFLDRDGVINKKRDKDYVKSLKEFQLLPKVIEAITSLSKIFGRVIIVTNQQGIGKKLMTEENLTQIHNFLIQEVQKENGSINGIYYAPQLAEEKSIMRKPEIGMLVKAKQDFPDINFKKSIMIGDSLSDMEFGKRAGIPSVLIKDEKTITKEFYTTNSLSDFNLLIRTILNKCFL